MTAKEILKNAHTILVIDWPAKDVPESLAIAGFDVVVQGGPGPEDYSVYELNSGKVVVRHLGRPPDRADLIYSHRPISQLPEILSQAKNLGAKTVWTQSGVSPSGATDPEGCWVSAEAFQVTRDLVQSAGFSYVSQPYIGDVAREIMASSSK